MQMQARASFRVAAIRVVINRANSQPRRINNASKDSGVMSKTPERLEDYPECRSDYDRLSEYVHPNTGQNLIIAWPSSKHADWVRISRRSKYAFVTAVNVSVGPTDKASRLIVRHVLDGNFPFAGEVYFPKQAKE